MGERIVKAAFCIRIEAAIFLLFFFFSAEKKTQQASLSYFKKQTTTLAKHENLNLKRQRQTTMLMHRTTSPRETALTHVGCVNSIKASYHATKENISQRKVEKTRESRVCSCLHEPQEASSAPEVKAR